MLMVYLKANGGFFAYPRHGATTACSIYREFYDHAPYPPGLSPLGRPPERQARYPVVRIIPAR